MRELGQELIENKPIEPRGFLGKKTKIALIALGIAYGVIVAPSSIISTALLLYKKDRSPQEAEEIFKGNTNQYVKVVDYLGTPLRKIMYSAHNSIKGNNK